MTSTLTQEQYSSGIPKITPEMATEAKSNIDIHGVFGKWIQSAEQMNREFVNAAPYPHIIIPDFLSTDLANQIDTEFPVDINDSAHWHKYNNPIEVKYANDHMTTYPASIRKLFLAYTHPEFIDRMRQLTGIPDLEYDEYMHGAGLHIHPTGGRLGVHLDYERHPITGKQRRINIILYMSSDWDPAWNGHTELWSADASECVVQSPVLFNQAIIFRTDDISWHGLPEPIQCPPGLYRKSIAYYYVSPFSELKDTEKAGMVAKREKARFVPRPCDLPVSEGLAMLYSIRPHRRITDADLALYMPEWTS
jgi:Rps23 Pro-64 3,4-dihydroxylase Tpa1-like proline 4-hydroxylase